MNGRFIFGFPLSALFGLCCFYLGSLPLTAQTGELRFEHLTTEDGLSQEWIYSIMQDSRGFVWIGTEFGLNRYDGERFRVYTNRDGLPNNYVSTVYEDRQGNIWAGTLSGLARIDTIEDTIRVFAHDAAKPDSLSSNDVTGFAEDQDGALWITTFNGLNRFDAGTETFKIWRNDKSNPASLPDNRVRTLYIDGQNRYWLGLEEGAATFDPQSEIFTPLDLTLADGRKPPVRKIASGVGDALWLATTEGLFQYHPADRKVRVWRHDPKKTNTPASNRLHDLIVDDSGNLWLATADGLDYFDVDAGVFHHHRHDPTRLKSLGHNTVYALMVDRGGLLWVGAHGNGISIWNPRTSLIEAFSRRPGNKHSLGGDVVWNFAEHPDGSLWVATESGLGRMDPATKKFTHYRHNRNNPRSLSHNTVYSTAVENNGMVWAGTAMGLNRLNPKTGAIKIFREDPDDAGSLSNDIVFTLLVDGLGYLWAGTDGGLNRWREETGDFRRHLHDPDDPRSLSGNSIRSLHQGSSGHIWVGTENGVNRYDPQSERFDRFLFEKARSSTDVAAVTAMCEAEPGVLWLGHAGTGLMKLDFRGNPFEPIATTYDQTVFPNQNLFSLLPDDRGRFWIATSRGLVRFHPDSGEIRVFDSLDGLLSNELNEGAGYRSRAGKMYFGSVRGFNAFYPEDLEPTFPPPNVTIVAIDLADRKTIQGRQKQPIVMTWEQRADFRISFAAMDYTKRGRNRYRYRLLGFHRDWREVTGKGEANYTNLGAGSYTFEVIAINSDEVPSPKPARLRIRIEPPVWRSRPVLVLYLIFFSTLAGFLIRARILKRREKERTDHELRESEKRLKLALWGSGGFMWDWNSATDEIYRKDFPELLGYEDENFSRKTLDQRSMVHPSDLFQVEKSWQDHISGKSPYFEAEYRIRSAKGTWRWIHERGMAADRDKLGRALRMSGTYKDVSEQKRTEDKIRLFAKAFENTTDAMMILNTRQVIIAVNSAFSQITGYTTFEAAGQHISVLNSNRHEADFYEHLIDMVHTTDKWEGEFWAKRKDGEEFPMWVNMSLLRDTKGMITNYVAVFSDITERKRAEEELRHLANYDVLTGLPNRTLFQDRLNQALRHAQRHDTKLALLFIDLDHFKKINDSFGHAVGDLLLKGVSRRLVDTLRNEDTVARLGGDEFIVLLEDTNDPGAAAQVAQKLLSSVEQSFTLEGQEVRVNMSIGISLYPDDGHNMETLLKNADTAMYHSKNEGRNNFQFYTEELNVRAYELLKLENALRKAVELDQLLLLYQPQFSVPDGRLVGVEALVRWDHPDKGMVSPGTFIPLAEETGVINALGAWVLDEACRQATEWNAAGIDRFTISVNLSAEQLKQRDLVETVARIMSDHQIGENQLELEITEGVMIDNRERTIETLERFREMGIRLAMDDFGTGYSSLSYLRTFPIDKLKIDRTFVKDVINNSQSAAIARTIINLAENLSLEVMAEGVETIDQLSFLNNSGCHIIQGFLLGKPLPAEMIPGLIDNEGIQLIMDQIETEDEPPIRGNPG
ncbi:MAG: EAL domain-containing protein [Acidobacteriota bacterium]|nr:EAL domain-containing protein [Acidobacteriota bacterium]